MSADDTLIESSFNETNKSRFVNATSPHHFKPNLAALAPGDGHTEIVNDMDQPQANMHKVSPKPSRDPLTSIAGAPKVARPRRRKTTMGPTTDGPPPPFYPKDTYTDDDLLKLLMYRRKQGQEQIEYFRITQKQKEAEIQKLRDMCNHLTSRLEEVEKSETQKAAELSRIKGNKPIWETKIKRLSDYVKGLTNDHKRLREDADDLHKQHKSVLIAGKELQNALANVQKSAEQERTKSQQLTNDACHKIETLEQTVQHQNSQLHGDEILLTAERERSNRLEDQISNITTSHRRLLELFTGHRDTITDKMDDLLHQARSIVPTNNTCELESHGTMMPILEQCVGMLRELHSADAVRPEDLWKLNGSMDSFAQGFVPFL